MPALPPLTAISNGTAADATEVDGNFDTLATFVRNEVVNRDGSIPMTAELLLANSSPSTALAAASKGYVDGESTAGSTAIFARTTNIAVPAAGSASVSFETETNDLDGWWAIGQPTLFFCPATGIYAITLRVEAIGSSGSFSATTSFTGGGLSADVSVNNAGAASIATNGAVAYLKTGETFGFTWSNAGLGVEGTITDVMVSITRIATV